MFRSSKAARRPFRGGLGSALALALAFAGGATVFSAPAMAQAQPEHSRGFAQVYQPVADVANAQVGDFAAARAQLPAVFAQVSTPDDRFAAGNVALVLGTKLEDRALQRQGLEMMLASGKTPPQNVGQFHFFVGSLAYDAKDYGAARAALQQAVAAGYTENEPQAIIADSYFNEGQSQQGLTYLKSEIDKLAAAGRPVPDAWLVRGLQVAVQNNLNQQANDWSAALVQHSPSQHNWTQAIKVVGQLNSLDAQTHLDLLRLAALTDALGDRNAYETYIEAADPRVMSNEVARVLASAVRAGALSTTDSYYADVNRIVTERAPADRADAPKLASEARSAASGVPARSAGDVYLSLGQYAEAEAMYQLALEKGGVDRDQLLTRVGIAQVHQNKHADARSTFEQVGGSRAVVAKMWQAYIENRA